MIFDAQSFSQFETCPRFPQLYRSFEPPAWPIREAVKRFFETGIRGIMAGESPELTVSAFLAAAANPGFIYPQGEHFMIAQDHASWLDGALRIVLEENANLEQLPLYQIGDHQINLEAWEDGDVCHIYRIQSEIHKEPKAVHWPELCAMVLHGGETKIHSFKLPSVRMGRLTTPLNMAYQHPTFANIQYRLSRLYDEPDFGPNWKRIGRWEIQPNPPWEEWRLGIERDQCIDKIREIYTVCPTLDTDERDRLLFDIEQMCVAQERPSIFPRFRETCQSCVFNKLCHGSQEDRREYKVLGPEEIDRVLNISLDTV